MSKIKQWIKKGEGKTIEFKRTLPDGNHIAKTVIAFSNMAGGLFFKIVLYKKKRQHTTIETTKETTAKTSGESKKITPKTLSEKDISTSRETTRTTSGETTAKDSGNTTTKTTMDTQRETIDDGFGNLKTTTKATMGTTAKTSRESEGITPKELSKEDIGTSGEMTEEKGTTIETTTETTIKIHGPGKIERS
jgi:hypothetical protein